MGTNRNHAQLKYGFNLLNRSERISSGSPFHGAPVASPAQHPTAGRPQPQVDNYAIGTDSIRCSIRCWDLARVGRKFDAPLLKGGWTWAPGDRIGLRVLCVKHRTPYAPINTETHWCSRCIYCNSSWDCHQSGLISTRNSSLIKGRREAVQYPNR